MGNGRQFLRVLSFAVILGVATGCVGDWAAQRRIVVAESLLEAEPDTSFSLLSRRDPEPDTSFSLLSRRDPEPDTSFSLLSRRDPAPDSAFALLSRLDPETMRVPSIKARYTLVRSLAAERSGRPVPDDSLVRDAHVWYLRHGSPRRLMQSWFCLGTAQLETGAYGHAVNSFLNAEKQAARLRDPFFRAKCLLGVAESFSGSWMDSTAAGYHHAAADLFRAAGKDRHADGALLSEAICLNRCGRGDSTLFAALAMRARENRDSLFLGCIHLVHASWLMKQPAPDYPEALALFLQAEPSVSVIMDGEAYADMAYAFQRVGDRAAADLYLERAAGRMTGRTDRSEVLRREAQVLFLRGDKDEAQRLYDKALTLREELYRDKLEHSVTVAQRDYLIASREQVREKLTRRTIMWILALALVALAVLAWVQQRILARTERESYLADLAALRDEMAAKTAGGDDLQRTVGDLLRRDLSLINDLSDAYLAGKMADPLAVTAEAEEYIRRFRSGGSYVSDLIHAVNLHEAGLLDRLRHQVPSLTAEEQDFAALFYAGLSTGSIRILTQETRSNIYTIKSRIKAKILASEVPDRDEFVSKLNSPKV